MYTYTWELECALQGCRFVVSQRYVAACCGTSKNSELAEQSDSTILSHMLMVKALL